MILILILVVVIIRIVLIRIIRRLIGTVSVILRRLGSDILRLAERENRIKNRREESHADAEARALAETLRKTEVEPDLDHKHKHQKRQHQNSLNDSPDNHRQERRGTARIAGCQRYSDRYDKNTRKIAPMIIAQNAFVVQTVLNSI